jgi:hypothetical protein
MRIAFFFCFILMVVSCKQDTKINLPELKEGYYEFEILEKYIYPADSTTYLASAATGTQFKTRPGFLIKKTTLENAFQACVTYRELMEPGCSPVNLPLTLVYINNDSIYLQKPYFYIDGSFTSSQHVPWNGSLGPTILVDSTLKYQAQITGLKLNNNSEIEGYWREIFKSYYRQIDNPNIIDSIVDQPIFAKFKLKYVKGI